MSETERTRRQRQSDRDKANFHHYRRWVSDKFLSDYYEVSRVTIWNWAKSGKLPAPQKIGDNTTRWDFEKILKAEQAA